MSYYDDIIRLGNIHRLMLKRCGDHPGEWHKKYYEDVSVDERFLDRDFFISWSLNNGYAENLELDRIDTAGSYSPENCRWVSHKENMRNIRTVHLYGLEGKMLCIGELLEDTRCVVSRGTLRYRLSNEWDTLSAISTPTRKRTVQSGR